MGLLDRIFGKKEKTGEATIQTTQTGDESWQEQNEALRKEIMSLVQTTTVGPREQQYEALCELQRLYDDGNSKMIIAEFVEMLRDQHAEVRCNTIRKLKGPPFRDDYDVIGPIIKALEDENSRVRYEAAYALADIRPNAAITPLINALKDKDESVLEYAVYALGEICNPMAVEPLKYLYPYATDKVKKRIEQALVKISRTFPELRIETESLSTKVDEPEGVRQVEEKMEKKKLYHEDGTIWYEGEVKDGQPHGQGTEYYENGTIGYEGEFKNGMFHGQGTEYFEDGTIKYEGEYKDGQPHGQGKFYWQDGTIGYEGEFKNGMFHGQGTLYWEERHGTICYIGEWEDDKFHGQGTEYYEDGTIKYKGEFYEGEFKDG